MNMNPFRDDPDIILQVHHRHHLVRQCRGFRTYQMTTRHFLRHWETSNLVIGESIRQDMARALAIQFSLPLHRIPAPSSCMIPI